MHIRTPRRAVVALAASALGLGAGAIYGVAALATPGINFLSETLARTYVDQIAVNTTGQSGHRVKIQVKDPSDVYVVRNTVPPGGQSGWHTHPGPSIVSVTAGVATVYHGDDPSCTPVTYPAGTAFVDPVAAEHVHMVRNEGNVDLVTVAFQIIPAGAGRRIDAPDPGYCGF